MTPEAQISHEIKIAIGAQPDLLLLRNTVGQHNVANENSNEIRTLKHGLGVGSPDFVCMLKNSKGLAIWFCLEVKVPKKKPNADQIKCHDIWRKSGALIYSVTSGDEAMRALEHARRLVG